MQDIDTGFDLVSILLEQQQQLTAVERFSQLHAIDAAPLHGHVYKDLIPVETPGVNQQYAFEVDLDTCSGCKACVAACHNLNGLEEGEAWRDVGLLLGGTVETPLLQHVTTSCHHCLDPACLEGCPVNAYDKDETTGIVRHLDDQCIGCQYCIFKCPYEVPRYSSQKGIVRKCDMCHDRLNSQEAPACVQSCPNHAIKITIVDAQDVIAESESNQFLPSAPKPEYTLPTTRFKTTRPFPRNALAADYFQDRPQHAHWPLVIMLVLTQLSVGSFAIQQYFGQVLRLFGADHAVISSHTEFETTLGTWPVTGALLFGFIGLAASILHLGRPIYAFRAILGLRRSWLSREIVAFGLFASLATLFSIVSIVIPEQVELTRSLATTTCVIGFAAVVCSILVYVDTPRELWSPYYTSVRFLLTCVVLGLPTTIMLLAGISAISGRSDFSVVMQDFSVPVARGTLICAAIKLSLETILLLNLKNKRLTAKRRTARLLTTELGGAFYLRLGTGVMAGILLPAILLTQPTVTAGEGFNPLFYLVITMLSWVGLLVGELLERYLFFTSVTTERMPGTAV